MPTKAVADARGPQWRKVIFNASTNPIGALTRLTPRRVCERADLRRLVTGLVDEGKAVAAAQGIELDADPEELIDHAAQPEVAYDHKASMLQDVEARRQTEIDYLNGGIVRFGQRARRPDAAECRDRALVITAWSSHCVAARSRPPLRPRPRGDGASTIWTRWSSAGSEYTGFEGAVRYLSGFLIVHRYAYVLLPREGDPTIVFPAEARYVGEHGDSWIEEQVFVDRPGEWLADRWPGKRVGVYGARLRHAGARLRSAAGTRSSSSRWTSQFDLARAVKSDAELESVRDSVRINTEGFWAFLEAYAPGKTAAEVLAPAEKLFVEEGCGRLTMNMVLVGAEFAIGPQATTVLGDILLPSLEIAGPGGHWVEVSRATRRADRRGRAACRGLRGVLRGREDGAAARRDRARRPPRGLEGLHRPRLSPRPRHRPLDRDDDDRVPEDRRGRRDRARARAWSSRCTRTRSPTDGRECLYMQDTWLVTADGGEPLADLPMQIY